MAAKTLLFVCHFNSARSQLAEALARSLAPRGTRILSAGLVATVVNEEVLRSLSQIGLDASRQQSKPLDRLAERRVDEVFVFCKEARRKARRMFPRARHRFWPVADPIAVRPRSRVPSAVRRARARIQALLTTWFGRNLPCA